MKQINLAILLMVSMSSMRAEHAEQIDVKPYQNHIENIAVIDGLHKQTVRLKFSHYNPIIIYAPNSFEQVANNDYSLFIAPNTTIKEPFNVGLIKIIADGKNLKIHVFGKVILRKIIADSIIIVIQKNISD